jgi:16S rRNA G527 N7-methylase RsmG
LSAIRDADSVLVKHIKDSIELEKILKIKNWKTICDIWTWGWFPLMPLAMINPWSTFVWIDARRKKVDAVNDIIKTVGIKNAQCKRWRIEDFAKDKKIEKFDYITARAVWYTDKIIPRSYDLLKKGWSFIFYKQYDFTEYQSLLNLCKKYKLDIKTQHKYKLFDWDIERVIYIIKRK